VWTGEGRIPIADVLSTVQETKERVSVDCHNAGARSPSSRITRPVHPHALLRTFPTYRRPSAILIYFQCMVVRERGRSGLADFEFLFIFILFFVSKKIKLKINSCAHNRWIDHAV